MGIVSTLLARCLAQKHSGYACLSGGADPTSVLARPPGKATKTSEKNTQGGGGERRRGSRGDPEAHLVAEEQRRIELSCDILQQPPRGGPRGRGGAAAPPRMRAYWLCAPLMPTALACRRCARQR